MIGKIFMLGLVLLATNADANPAFKPNAAAKPSKAYPVPLPEMVAEAISALKERKGSSRKAILKYIMANYKIDRSPAQIKPRITMALKQMSREQKILVAGSKEGALLFKLPGKKRPVKVKVVKKPKRPAAKKNKKSAEKKIRKQAESADGTVQTVNSNANANVNANANAFVNRPVKVVTKPKSSAAKKNKKSAGKKTGKQAESADGTVQTVNSNANDVDGYVAEVTFPEAVPVPAPAPYIEWN